MTGSGTLTGGTTTVGVAFAIFLLGLRTFGLGVGCLAATVGWGAGSGVLLVPQGLQEWLVQQ